MDPEQMRAIETDPNNTTLFIGNLGTDVDEDLLRRYARVERCVKTSTTQHLTFAVCICRVG